MAGRAVGQTPGCSNCNQRVYYWERILNCCESEIWRIFLTYGPIQHFDLRKDPSSHRNKKYIADVVMLSGGNIDSMWKHNTLCICVFFLFPRQRWCVWLFYECLRSRRIRQNRYRNTSKRHEPRQFEAIHYVFLTLSRNNLTIKLAL